MNLTQKTLTLIGVAFFVGLSLGWVPGLIIVAIVGIAIFSPEPYRSYFFNREPPLEGDQ